MDNDKLREAADLFAKSEQLKEEEDRFKTLTTLEIRFYNGDHWYGTETVELGNPIFMATVNSMKENLRISREELEAEIAAL